MTPLGSPHFGHLNSYFLANFLLFHVDLKAIKAFDQVKKVSVLYLLRFLYIYRLALYIVRCERLISYITKYLKDIGLDKMIDLIFNQ